jgi:DNA-binding CsgD family transcriptional regulator
MQEQLAAMQQAMEEMDRAILSVSDNGHIRWATPRAYNLLVSYALQGKRRTDWLPSLLREWLKEQLAQLKSKTDLPTPLIPLTVERGNRSLRVRLVKNGTHCLLFLEEPRTDFSQTSLNQLGLSRRETEILSWVAQGKSNPEIGTILGISPRTVQKHLERVYGRLGVENRHAAMTIALETARNGH